jgi:hypothetical protein
LILKLARDFDELLPDLPALRPYLGDGVRFALFMVALDVDLPHDPGLG